MTDNAIFIYFFDSLRENVPFPSDCWTERRVLKRCLKLRYRVLSYCETKFYIQATALSYDGGAEGPPGVAWS